MKKLNYLYFYTCLLLITFVTKTNAQITNTINGINLSGNNNSISTNSCNPINFVENTPNLTITTSINYALGRNANVVTGLGTLKIMLKINSSSTPTLITQNDIPEANWANNTTTGTIIGSFNGSAVQSTGSVIYLEYKTQGGTIVHSCQVQITKTPPPPSFSLSPTSLNIDCGNTNARTFTITPTNIPSGVTVTYQWSHPGWNLISSTTNSRTLQPISGTILPSNVSVVPSINGVAKPSMSCSVSRAPISSSATITGNTAICPSNSVVYIINNLGAGNTVTWSSSNTAVATVSGGTQSQVTVNGVANGFADIIATISNACGQTVIKKNTVYVGVPTTPAAGIYANPMWVRNNFFPLTIDFPVIPNATSYVWTIENDPENPPYCTTATSYPAKFVLNNSNTTLATTTPSAKINFGGCFGTYFIKCKAINNCGETDVFYKHIWVGSSGSSPCDKNNNISSEFKILQNPIKNGVLKLKTDILFNNDIITEDASILQGDGPCEGPWEAPIIGKISSQNLNTVIAIYDMAGVKRLEKQIDNNKESIEITNFNLPSGNYILHFKKGNQISKKIIIIE